MEVNILQIGNIIGYVLQTLYFVYFFIKVKNIKDKKILFLVSIFLEFILLKYFCKLNYTVNFDIIFGIIIYLLIKIIYKEKSRITDLVNYIIAVLILGITSIITSLIFGFNIYGLFISNLSSLLVLYIFRNKLNKIEIFYSNFWNKHSNKKMLKSITIRGISSVLTIITFILAHFWFIYGIFISRR